MPSITGEQKMTTLGLLGATGAAVLFADNVPQEHVMLGSIAFGTGVAVSNSFYRVAELLKNGKPEKNKFGKGLFAGVSLFCGLLGFKTMPFVHKVLTAAPFKLTSQTVLLIFVAFGIGGFLQNRNTFLNFVEDDEEASREGR